MDTIFALSSGQPPCGVAVVRVSGPDTLTIVESLFESAPKPRQMTFGPIRARNNEVIDMGLCVYFPGPSSFTGEDVCEFHLHGSQAVVKAVFETLRTFPGVRDAEAGEFAQRAFLQGKFDLTVAEGLADIIDAQTEEQRRLALRQGSGASLDLYQSWQDDLLVMRAQVEAEIDFADEDDVPFDVADSVAPAIGALVSAIEHHLSGLSANQIIREGFVIALVGVPNAGKSSLFNALLGDDRVIVSDMPGTTRDYVEEAMDIDGYLVRIIDTAGLRETSDDIERMGIDRSFSVMDRADLVLELSADGRFALNASSLVAPVYKVQTKIDVVAGTIPPGVIPCSVLSEGGLDAVLSALRHALQTRLGSHSERAPINARHKRHLVSALSSLRSARESVGEIRAERLRVASEEIGKITGAIGTEDVLGAIFSRFCIGK